MYRTGAVLGAAATALVGTSLAYGESPLTTAQRTGLIAIRATRDISTVLAMVSGLASFTCALFNPTQNDALPHPRSPGTAPTADTYAPGRRVRDT